MGERYSFPFTLFLCNKVASVKQVLKSPVLVVSLLACHVDNGLGEASATALLSCLQSNRKLRSVCMNRNPGISNPLLQGLCQITFGGPPDKGPLAGGHLLPSVIFTLRGSRAQHTCEVGFFFFCDFLVFAGRLRPLLMNWQQAVVTEDGSSSKRNGICCLL